jgi:hypothetical protein
MRSAALFVRVPLLVVALLLAACSDSKPALSLSGDWASDGYDCPANVYHHETVHIVQTGTRVEGTKIVGDDCVKGGHTSFTGELNGNIGSLDYWLAAPGGTPTVALRNQRLTVVTKNRFTVAFNGRQVSYDRTSGRGSSGSPWWPWLLAALLALLLIGYAERRRRRSRWKPA